LYCVILSAQLAITSFNSGNLASDRIKKAQFLEATAGKYLDLRYSQDPNAMIVTMPSKKPYDAMAYVIKLTLTIPLSK
jgi:hypothetical protein